MSDPMPSAPRTAGLAILLAALAVAPAARADRAPPTPDSLSVDIVITERSGDRPPAALEVTLTLDGPRGCSTASTGEGSGSLDVKVCRNGDDTEAPLLEFDVSRHDARGAEARTRRFRVVSRIARGARATIGRLGSSSGTTEIVTSVR